MTTTLAFVVFVVIVVAGVLFFQRWRRQWTPERKKWCVLLYFVARQGDSSDDSLDAKLAQVLTDILALPCATSGGEGSNPTWKDVHVVYRVVWAGANKAPEARVVHWRSGAPVTDYFPGVIKPLQPNLTDDLRGFFEWTYANCSAEHYAVYFWGHSFGPGGLFSERGTPVIDPPPGTQPLWSGLSQEGLQSSLRLLVELRLAQAHDIQRVDDKRAAGAPIVNIPAGGISPPPPGGQPPQGALLVPPKVELVLFQNCWMSTLETAYTLQNVARYLVASQSLVPIGLKEQPSASTNTTVFVPNPTATWPYKAIVDALLTQVDFSRATLDELQHYYDASDENRFPDTTVPFALLDLGAGQDEVHAVLTGPFKALVTALGALDLQKRKQLIEFGGRTAGRLYDMQGTTLRAGDVALLDVLKLCAHLKTQSAVGTIVERQNLEQAATALESALLGSAGGLKVVGPTFESTTLSQLPLGFQGISVLYKPSWFPSGAQTMLHGVDHDYYKGLLFAQKAQAGTNNCWTIYAFEQLGYGPTCN